MPVDSETHKARFHELSGAFRRSELARLNEDGSTTTVVSFERYVDPMDRRDMTLLSEFRLRAAAAGMREAFSPLVLPTQAVLSPRETEAVRLQGSDRPLTLVQLGYEKPAPQPAPAPQQASRP
jgi:hypothetical protein